MGCTPLPVWANQLTRLPCLVVAICVWLTRPAWLWAHCRADRTTSMTSSLMDDPTDQDRLLLKHQLNSFEGNSIATSLLLILSRAVVRASWSSQELFLSNSALSAMTGRICFVTLLTDRIGSAIGQGFGLFSRNFSVCTSIYQTSSKKPLFAQILRSLMCAPLNPWRLNVN